MKYSIEDAIIVATYEHDVRIPVETVVAEPITPKRRRSPNIFSSIFSMLDVFDMFTQPDETVKSEPVSVEPEPEVAEITDSNEQKIEEIRFAYYEFLD